MLFSCKVKQKEVTKTHKKQHHNKISTTKKSDKKETNTTTELEEKLGITKHEINRDKLFSFVKDWYGVPYKYGGCEKSGVDCSCFTSILYGSVYKTTLNRTVGDMFKACEQIEPEAAKEGDLYFFKINGNQISHVGVCVKKNLFVHASSSRGVIVNSIEEAYYKKYFFCAGRIKKT